MSGVMVIEMRNSTKAAKYHERREHHHDAKDSTQEIVRELHVLWVVAQSNNDEHQQTKKVCKVVHVHGTVQHSLRVPRSVDKLETVLLKALEDDEK